MSDQLTVDCGKADHRGVRVVVASLGGKSHRSKFDCDDAFRRKKFRQEIVTKFALDETANEWIEEKILAAADSVDEHVEAWQAGVESIEAVEPEQTRWLWDQYFPAGALVVLDGDPGLGKSQLTIDIAARLSRGDCMPPLNAPDGMCERRGILLLNCEDDKARTLRPRLDAAGADLSRILLLGEMRSADGEDSRPVSLPRDIAAIQQIIEQNNIGLVIIDPFVAYLDAKLSANTDSDVRRCLGQLATMAESTGATILLVRHLNKKSGQSAKYRGGGSIGITGAARAVFMVGEDPDDNSGRILAPVKCNLGPEPRSLRFSIESVDATSRIRWGDACDISAADILDASRPRQNNKSDQAAEIIERILADGPRGSNEVMQACLDAGFSEKTYHRARKDLGVLSERTGFGGDGQWLLTLPSRNGAAF